MKLNFLEPSGSLRACNGTALPLPYASCYLNSQNVPLKTLVFNCCGRGYDVIRRWTHVFVAWNRVQGFEVRTVCCFLNCWTLSQLYADIHTVKLPHSLYSNVTLRVKRSKPTFSFLGLHKSCSANSSLANAKQGPRVKNCSREYCHILLWIVGNEIKCYTSQPEF